MTPSAELCWFTKASEGLSLKAYPDHGAYSCCYGHRSVAIKPGDVFTEQQCENFFEWDMQQAAEAVTRHVKVPLNQGQFDCLCDFVFNEGEGHLAGSMMLAALNQGNYARVPLELYRTDPETGEKHGWIMAGGAVSEALIARREGEIEFWNGTYQAPRQEAQEATA